MASIKLNNISKWFADNHVIRDINLDINDGEFIVLVGPSGCGKSTLLRMISGLETVDDGEIFLDKKLINNLIPSKRGIAMVFQSYALYPHMNVYENMSFGLKMEKLSKSEIDQKVNEAANTLQIKDLLERKPKELSGGQRQRVAIGRAITRNPKLFLFDEPLSNLDAALRSEMRVEISKLHEKMKSNIIYVTHDQVEAMTLADRIIIMKDGYIEQIGSPIDIFNKPANVFVATFIGSPPMNILQCEIVNKNNDLMIKIDENIFMPCPSSKKESLSKMKKIYLGIRAEDIMPIEKENLINKSWSFQKEIDLAEPLGTETQLFFKLKGKEIISRMYNPHPISVGEKINFSIDPDKAHFFNIEDEKAIF